MENILDDTYCIVKHSFCKWNFIKSKQFSHEHKSTYEAESNNMLPFLDVLVIHKNNNIETTVYRKPTNDDIYLN